MCCQGWSAPRACAARYLLQRRRVDVEKELLEALLAANNNVSMACTKSSTSAKRSALRARTARPQVSE
eukprot:3128406-Rhodomonas_salina.2